MEFRVFVLAAVLLGCSAQYRPYPKPIIGSDCPDVKYRYQDITQKIEEFTRTVDIKFSSYDAVFSDIPHSKGVLCGMKESLEELKLLLVRCKRSSSTDKYYVYHKWILKIEDLSRFASGFCGLVSTRGPEISRLSQSVVSFREELSSFKSTLRSVDVASCDPYPLQTLESKFDDLKQKWGEHQSFIAGVHRGRAMDRNNVTGSAIAGNSFTLKMVNSAIKDSSFDLFGVKTTTTNNIGAE